MPTITPSTSHVSLTDLKGKAIPQDDTKVAQTASHTLHLASRFNETYIPDFRVTLRNIADPKPKSQFFARLPPSVVTFAPLQKAFQTAYAKEADYLFPKKEELLATLAEDSRSNFAFLSIMGQRIEHFFDEAMVWAESSNLSPAEKTKARQEINLLHRQAFYNRDVQFDRADTGSYWGYTSDHAFVHVFEKLVDSLKESDPRREFFQKQVDYILTHQYTPDGTVDEYNIEKSLSLIAIDAKSRHRVSLTAAAEKSASPAYEFLVLPKTEGEPADRYAFRSGKDYFFEDNNQKLSEESVALLKHEPVADVVLRRKKTGETFREQFRFNWQGGLLSKEKVSTGWWGFCDIKATLQTILADMPKSGGVKEFRSDTGKVTELDRSLLLEALAALLNLGDSYQTMEGEVSSLDDTRDGHGGLRFDAIPDEMVIETASTQLSLPIKIQTLSKRNGGGQTDLDLLFSANLPDKSLESFSPNPNVVRNENGRINFVRIDDRKLTATMTKRRNWGYTFNPEGQIVEQTDAFALDPHNSRGDRVLVATQLVDANDRKVDRYYYYPEDATLRKASTQFVEAEGKYTAKEEAPENLGEVLRFEAGRERSKDDDAAGKLSALEGAIRSGDKISCDSDPSEKVWNGDVYNAKIEREWISPDKKWERLRVSLDATFGYGKTGTIINKLGPDGQVVESCEIKPVVDFFWKSRTRVAPIVKEGEKVYFNTKMKERGILTLGENLVGTIGALQDLHDLIYLGFAGKDHKPLHTIVHEGTRLVYQDPTEWQRDVEKLKTASAEINRTPSAPITTEGSAPTTASTAL